MLEVCFERARGMFLTALHRAGVRFRPCSRHVLTVLDRAGAMFRLCSRYVLTVFDPTGGKFRPCSRYELKVLTVLEVCFDRARDMY